MAAGNQLENGICALFVVAATIIRIEREGIRIDGVSMRFQWDRFKAIPIDKRISTSPTRLVSAVIIPAPNDFGFW